jgi:hypothetical protein
MNQRGERHGTTPEILLGAYIAIATVDAQPPIRVIQALASASALRKNVGHSSLSGKTS